MKTYCFNSAHHDWAFLNFVDLKQFALIACILLCTSFSGTAQENDTVPYQLFKDRVVLFGDLGFNSAPFSIKDDYELGVNKLKFKNNLRAVLGLGFAYRWFALRIGFALPGQLLAESKYGKTEYFDVGLKFSVKQTYCTLDLRSYRGYAIKDAYQWNDTLSKDKTPNDLRPGTRAASISANVWWLLSKKYNMKAVLGTAGHFTGEAKTWYLKTSLNYFGINNDFGSIVPNELADSSDRTNASAVGAIDLGLIPGYAYSNRIKNWQFSIFAGLGGVIQSKFYTIGSLTRSFIGVAPRVDFRLTGGYSKQKFFVLLATDFDIKSVKIQDLSYNQTFYSVKLIGGVRIPTKRSRAQESN